MKKMDTYPVAVAKKFGEYVYHTRVQGKKEDQTGGTCSQIRRISPQFLGKIEKGEVPIPVDIQAKIIVLLKIPAKAVKSIYENAAKERANNLMKLANTFKSKI